MGIILLKPLLVCTFYDKQINAKKFGSVQALFVGDCRSKQSPYLPLRAYDVLEYPIDILKHTMNADLNDNLTFNNLLSSPNRSTLHFRMNYFS